MGLARPEPFGALQAWALRAVSVAAGVVGEADQPAVAALLGVPTECLRPTGFDRRHDSPFDTAEMCGVAAPERLTVAAEHLRHLQRRAHRRRSGGWCHLEMQAVERAWRAADGAGGDLRVTRSGVQGAMPEQSLDNADVGAALQQVGGEAVPQRMDGDPLAQPGGGARRAG